MECPKFLQGQVPRKPGTCLQSHKRSLWGLWVLLLPLVQLNCCTWTQTQKEESLEVGWGGEHLGQRPGMRVRGRGVRERKRKLVKCCIGISHLLNLL